MSLVPQMLFPYVVGSVHERAKVHLLQALKTLVLRKSFYQKNQHKLPRRFLLSEKT